jgi:hypothetical protein
MMYVWANNAGTAPANPIGPSDLTIIAVDGDVFPVLAGGQSLMLTLEEGTTREIVQLVARAGNTLSLGGRGLEGTSPASFTIEATIELRLTAGQLATFAQGIDNEHQQDIPPQAINLQPGRATNTRVASASFAVAVGYDTLASATDAMAVGARATASGLDSAAIGADTQATGAEALAIGNAARATGLRAMAIGPTMSAGTYFISGQEAVGIGYNVINSGAYGLAMGTGAQVSAIDGIALGRGSLATVADALAVGHQARADGTRAIYLGTSTATATYFAEGDDSIAIGTDAHAATQYDIAIGRRADADGGNALALGQGATAVGINAIAIGGASSAPAEYTCNITATSLLPAPLSTGLTSANHLALQTAMVSALGTAAFSLGAVANGVDAISMPSGTKFFPTDVMLIIVVASGAGTGTPAISVGSSSGGDSILASTTASGLTSVGAAQSWPATSSAGVTAIYVNVTGTDAASGRVIIRGVLVAD